MAITSGSDGMSSNRGEPEEPGPASQS
jgi:hypothetical protein